jgi:diaminohydroxyphosphoribosylaminopyrimidine deaminase / 5-amino-6-(5-phosphoribosylamino)uracil reductase
MRRALALATRGWGRVSPNPLVGAVAVREGRVVGEGWHREYGQPHAEVEALRAAGDAATGCTLYVTLEPCGHHGKTPPCTAAVLAAGVRRLVYACADPDPRAGGGAAWLAARGVEVEGGVCRREAEDLNAAFLHVWAGGAAAERPWVALKLALTLDARLADHEGRSAWITGEQARAEVHRLRAGFDAVAVGVGTALADDPLLTVRGAVEPRIPPVRVVFDRRLRTPAASRLVQGAREVPVWIVSAPGAPPERARALEEAGVRVIEAAGTLDALLALRRAGLRSVFVEGGAGLAAALLDAEVVDRMYLFYAPLLLGGRAPSAFGAVGSAPLAGTLRWRHLESGSFGPDTLVTLAR